ncbi:Transcription-associated protein [Dirofilaria immitis]
MRLIVAFTWLLIATIVVPEIYFCMQEFDGIYLQWKRKCGTSKISIGLKFFRDCIILGLPIIIFIMHIAIFNNLRRKRISVSSSETSEFQNISCITQLQKLMSVSKLKSTSGKSETNKNEISILIQGAILCATVELEVIAFKFLRKISYTSFNDTDIRLNIIVNCLIICLSAVQPTVYFICNKRIRHYVTIELMSKIKNTKGMIAIRQMLSTFSAKFCCHFCQH